MKTYNAEELEKVLLEKIGAKDELTLKEWEKDPCIEDPEMVKKFWDLVKKAPGVGIVGDYDCDGITASYIMGKAVSTVCPGKKMVIRIPRRFSEGYGINETIRAELNEKLPKGSVIITVDNGVAAGKVLEGLESDGYVVLMTDHHDAKADVPLPKVTFAVNPAVPELSKGFSFKGWCGAAVAYKLCEQVIPGSLRDELEVYAGLATVADCMVLKGANWGIVRRSIEAFREGKGPKPLAAMLTAMKQDPLFANEDSFGYYLGPCFNAAGRLEDAGASLVLKYLFAPSQEGLDRLVALNDKRKELRDAEYELVKAKIAEDGSENSCPIYVHVPGLHEGIVGILAGKVAEDYKVPALVCTTKENNPDMYVGSARSYGDFNIFEYMSGITDLFDRWGGHPGAAGFSLTAENFEKARLVQEEKPAEELGEDMKWEISKEAIPAIDEKLGVFRPFGEGNPAPVFEVPLSAGERGISYMGKELVDESGNVIKDSSGIPIKPHLCIRGEDSQGRKFKITHFGHYPELLGVSNFKFIGKITGTSYLGVETPTFNTDEVER